MKIFKNASVDMEMNVHEANLCKLFLQHSYDWKKFCNVSAPELSSKKMMDWLQSLLMPQFLAVENRRAKL